MYVREFQKRGVRHVHIFIISANGFKLLSPMDYDHVICAEIPDQNADPELYNIIAKGYMHGPCGDMITSCACMKNACCSNGYSKEFADATMDNQDGYPIYRRRNNGRTALCRGHVLDNRWVVPHLRSLSKRYNCDINVEYCAPIAAINHLHEYIYKGFGSGDAVRRDDAKNGIVEFVEGWYICTSKAVWHLSGFDMHEQFPPVMRLPIELKDQRYVRWSDRQSIPEVVPDRPQDTPSKAWFNSNTKSGHQFGKHLSYNEYAELFTYHGQSKT